MKSAFFCFYTAHPISGGASSVSSQTARHWPGQRMLVQIGSDGGEAQLAPGLRLVTLAYAEGGRAGKLAHVPGWARAMEDAAREFEPDVVVLEGACWVAYSWLLLRRLRRALPEACVIYHAHNVEYELRRQKHALPIAALTRHLEGQVLRMADVATAVSETDRAQFRRLYDVDVRLLPNGVDVSRLAAGNGSGCDAVKMRYGLGDEAVLFLGAYGYRPNREAIDFLIRDVFPPLLRRRPGARLVVLGGPVPYRRPWLIAPGLVAAAELPKVIGAATVSVAPIFSGSGTRLKILESLAAGTPVIATAKGMEGLPLRPGADIGVAETAPEFVSEITRCLEAPALMRRRSRAARDRVRNDYDWSTIVENFIARLPGRTGYAGAALSAVPSGEEARS